MKLEKITYPQPHNIKIYFVNEALAEHLRYKIHHRLKYQAKYSRSKFTKRQYESNNNNKD